MFHLNRIRFEEYITGTALRAHVSTVTVALSFNNVIRLPREGICYGIIPYLIACLIVSTILALPGALQQITVGQFQQNVIEAWRAVPFFKGIGYLKLTTSFLASIYVVIFLSMSFAYFVYGASGAIPFPECKEFIMTSINITNNISTSSCFNQTLMSPVLHKPHYYSVVSLVALVIWIASSYVMYGCMKYTKKIFYILSPTVIILSVLTLIFMADSNQSVLQTNEQWRGLLEPSLWFSSIVQVLMSNYISTGYTLAAGDTVYGNCNAKWSAMIFVFANLISSWFYSFYWYALNGNDDKDKHIFVILLIIYESFQRPDLHKIWSLLCLLMIFFSGIISMIMYLYPIVDVTRRIEGRGKWIAVIAICVSGILISVLVFAGRMEVMDVLDRKIVPSLVVFITVVEIASFAYIYGAALLSSDVEFLINNTLSKSWRIGWYLMPPLMTIIFTWWLYGIVVSDEWDKWVVLATFLVCLVVFVVFAAIAINQQIQYDWLSKVKWSFKALDWGPVDPITRYYWLARREEIHRGISGDASRPSRYSRNVLGQLSSTPSIIHLNDVERKSLELPYFDLGYKRRANSDDHVYNTHRKKIVKMTIPDIRTCSMSLDKDFVIKDPK